MSKVIYFNITYRCNSKCVFCFSNSTRYIKNEMESKDIEDVLEDILLGKDDLVVINGGEPFIHKQINTILRNMNMNVCCKKKIYTNGSLIANNEGLEGFTYVIPIHGNEDEHERVTGVKGLYRKTINSIINLQKLSIEYELKFILNESMIENSFDIIKFLEKYMLNPKRVILARLNETKISRENNVTIPSCQQVSMYINKQLHALSKRYEVVLLDIPFCLIDEKYRVIEKIEDEPVFIFNDVNNKKKERSYYKEIKIGEECEKCMYGELCSKMSSSYLTIVIKNGKISIEKE